MDNDNDFPVAFDDRDLASYDFGVPESGPYDSRDHLIASVNGYASESGFSVCIGRSGKFQDGTQRYVYLRCHAFGDYAAKRKHYNGIRIMTTKTSKRGCGFELYATCNKKDGTWSFTVKESKHNHPPDDAVYQAPLRRPNEAQMAVINQGLRSNHKTPQIMESLNLQFPGHVIVPKVIYHAKDKFKALQRSFHNTAEALEMRLAEKKVPYVLNTSFLHVVYSLK
jgi:hypothetical protein